MPPKLLAQGAEAKILLTNNKFIIKDRIKKSYRISELDNKIRKSRTKKEAKLLTKASKIINSPKPFFIPEFLKIKMPFIQGKKLSEHLDSLPIRKQKTISKKIGESLRKLHESNIIHGDLTTSNMILVEQGKKNTKKPLSKKNSSLIVNNISASKASSNNFQLYIIDFGLGFISHKYEDKATDLYLLKEALEAKHFKNHNVLFREIIKEYKKLKTSKTILERLKAVEKRRRYRH